MDDGEGVMDFRGEAIRATEASIAVIAAELGVAYHLLRGVIEVEAPRGPFDRQGRPTMLYEPHQFFQRVRADRRDEAVRLGVAQASRPGPGQYPADSYPRLEKAMRLDPEAALMSCSWGRGQVMGFNFRKAGYRSVHSMVEAAKRSESEQLRAMAEFIRASGLLPALKRADAHAFARGYNGAGYARDGYHDKLARAWAKWSRKSAPPVAREAAGDAPAPTMARSREGNAAVAGGAVATVTAAGEVARQMREAGDSVSGLVQAAGNPVVLALVVIAVLAGAIWWWRRQRLVVQGV